MSTSEHFYAVILAGGGGTRLWPKSRKSTPKHFLKLYSDKTLIQETYARNIQILPKERIFVITAQSQSELIEKQLPDLPKENLITEPEAKNTAMAMGLAVAVIYQRDPEAVIINLPADHLIENEKKFQDVVWQTLTVAAETDNIVAIALRPTYPHTGMGYIKIGDELENLSDRQKGIFVFDGKGYREKPDLITAQSFIASGQYLWNGGMYCWAAKTFIFAAESHVPWLAQGMDKIIQAKGKKEVLAEVYQGAESIAVDYAISEKAKNMVVIPGDFGWSDIGDWKVVFDTHPKNEENNVINGGGEFISIDTKESLIEGNGRLIATVGLKDIVIIDTPDALLVCAKDRSQDVKKVVEKLKAEKKEQYL